MPDDMDARHALMDAFGRRLHAALIAGDATRVMVGDDELRALLAGEDATRTGARRLTVGSRLLEPELVARQLTGTTYLGVCLQDAHDEGTHGPLGLRAEGWVFSRILLAASRPGGGRIATWIDGNFVLTDAGFVALDLEHVEAPRWEHSDLEIAPCDLRTRLE